MFTHKLNACVNTIEKVKQFVGVVSKYNDIDAFIVGKEGYVDAKSIMGIFSFDLTKDLRLIIQSYSNSSIQCLLHELQYYNFIC